jgi:hypothetical protein
MFSTSHSQEDRMPDKKLDFLNESVREAYRAGVERERQTVIEQLLMPIFAAYAKAARDLKAKIPTILEVAIVAAQMRCAMSTPEQRAVASGFIDQKQDESGPRPD